jgi:hypothetical protein
MRSLLAIFALATLPVACGPNANTVCEDVGYCTTESDTQVLKCKDEVKDLARESVASNCGGEYDAYFSCAADRYQCTGNVASFPGCDSYRTALVDCLAGGSANNACGELAQKLTACSPTTPPPHDVPQPCVDTGVCASRCYLDSVANVCSPQPPELADFTRCARSCPL